MSDMSLMALVAQTKDIVAVILEHDGQLTPEIEAALTVIEEKTPAKVDAYAIVMERLEMEKDYWKEKAEFYSRVAKSCENIRQKLRDNVKYAMEQLGTDELLGNDVRFKLVPAKSRLVINETYLPKEFFKEIVTMEPDKTRIEAELKAGADIEGAMLVENRALRQFTKRS